MTVMGTTDMRRVLDAVKHERLRQQVMIEAGTIPHPMESRATDVGYKLGVLMEEVGEVATAIIEREGEEALRKELIQVAAVAVAWAEALT